MECIECNTSLEKEYFIGEKSGMKIYFCHTHKSLCDNNCSKYECQNNFCRPA